MARYLKWSSFFQFETVLGVRSNEIVSNWSGKEIEFKLIPLLLSRLAQLDDVGLDCDLESKFKEFPLQYKS